jgi:hypothetical protein
MLDFSLNTFHKQHPVRSRGSFLHRLQNGSWFYGRKLQKRQLNSGSRNASLQMDLIAQKMVSLGTILIVIALIIKRPERICGLVMSDWMHK